MKCLCGTIQSKHLFQAGKYPIVACLVCGQVRTVTPKGISRKQVYQAEDVTIYIEKEQIFRRLFADVVTFIRQFKTSGTLIDIGAGVGLLVDEAKIAGFDAIGFEPSKEMVKAAKKEFGIELIPKKFHKATPCKRQGSGLENTKTGIDIVVINHVLEHLPNPLDVIRDIRSALVKNGLLVIGVPNFGSFLAIWKKSRWQSLIPDQHRWHFTIQSLDRLIQPLGFIRIGMRQDNHDRSMHPWWKRPAYWMLDLIAVLTGRAEAMLVVYQKI
ncbi:MAG: class I SAM-dependent methyltransferase [Patescibacteria group bacterium]